MTRKPNDPACLRAIAERLKSARNVVLLTHKKPDGDALGSTAAVMLALRERGCESHLFVPTEAPERYSQVIRREGLKLSVYAGGPLAEKADLVLVMDTSSESQLGGMLAAAKLLGCDILVVDHHSTAEDWASEMYCEPAIGSTGEITHELLAILGAEITPAIADSLLMAITTDTGWFQFANTRPATLRICAELMEQGGRLSELYEALFRQEQLARLKLHARGISSIDMRREAELAVMTLTPADFTECGAKPMDTENLVNTAMMIGSVRVCLLVSQSPGKDEININLRSKGDVDCAAILRKVGGGGHPRAAGATVPGPLPAARERLLGIVEHAMATEANPNARGA